jgi:hypothetical protein
MRISVICNDNGYYAVIPVAISRQNKVLFNKTSNYGNVIGVCFKASTCMLAVGCRGAVGKWYIRDRDQLSQI